jgi:tetratricopeptide (TPR) repeat protein
MLAKCVSVALLIAGFSASAASQIAPPVPSSPTLPNSGAASGKIIAATNDDPRFAVIKALMRGTKYSDALTVAETLYRSNHNLARAEFYVGLCLHKLRRYDAARPYLARAAERSTEFREGPHANHYLGWCAYYLGDLAGARNAFERHMNEFPNYDDTHFGLGLVSMDEDKLAEAERSFRTALDLIQEQNGRPRERAKNLARLGDVQLRMDQSANAEQSYREAVALWPDHHEAWAKLARILDRQARSEEAESARAQHRAAVARMSGKEPA